MKVTLYCKSILLEKALRKILDQYIVPKERAEILITDHKIEEFTDLPVFRIGYNDNEADLKKPFSRSQLMIKLEEKFKTVKQREDLISIVEDEMTLEKEVEALAKRFANDLLKIFKKYEKRD